ncbi:MAG: response regulator [Gammaproteobacteria bacterium]
MSRKLALVVDDSRAARVAMRKVLERYDFVVDTAESAEEALEYLGQSHPNVVFLDHMMPGMNGFQALKRIKKNPDTAAIPIMMFTSKEGEVYVSQARALGAVGVINKEVNEPELRQTLEELRLVEEAAAPELASVSPLFPDTQLDVEVLPTVEPVDLDKLRQQTKRLLEEHRAELRRDLQDASESAANRVADDFYEMLFGSEHIGPASINDFFRRSSAAAGAWKHAFYASVGVIILLLVLGYAAWPSAPAETAVAAALPPTEEPGKDDEKAAAVVGSAAVAAVRVARAQSTREKKRLLEAMEWAINNNSRGYDYGEIALDDNMLQTVNGLASRLSSIGFRGVLQLVVHVGNFCLVTSAAGELALPAPDLPLADCEVIGLSADTAVAEGERQSLGFANFLASSSLVNNSNLKVKIVSLGNKRPLQQYPPDSAALTAGAWNEIARRNNRVNVSIIPAGK